MFGAGMAEKPAWGDKNPSKKRKTRRNADFLGRIREAVSSWCRIGLGDTTVIG